MRKIKPGNILAAVSPAGPINIDNFEKAVETIKSAGFSIKSLPHVLDDNRYLAGSDRDRAADIMQAFTDPEVDAILATRGGYGSIRILDYLDFDIIHKNKKPLVGFSDLTVLQDALYKRSGLITYSGPQLVKGWGEDFDDFSRDFWVRMLAGEFIGSDLPSPDNYNLRTIRNGKNSGILRGGNLCVLSSICGTDYQPEFRDSILVLEEIDEPAYRIDRMITQLAKSGSFNGVKGILLGGFIQHVNGSIQDWTDLAAEILMEYVPDVPVVKGAPYAHVGPCWTLPIGAKVTLDADKAVFRIEDM